ncbi:MAG: helix-turn-helix domain-containing protein [Pseudomonadota bacterium]
MTYTKHIKKQSLEDWHRADIVAALRKSGWSLRKLSVANGYAAGSLGAALSKRLPNFEIIIAKAIGVHPMVIWPSRYDEHGHTTSHGMGRPKGSKNKPKT